MIYVLSDKKYKDAVNLPCIKINFLIKNINLKNYDALIFSSKNGAKAINQISDDWKDIPSYSIGSGTSKEIEKLGGKVIYEARSSYGDDFAKEIGKELKDKKVLFLRAKVVTSSLNTILQDAGVLIDEEVVYETICFKCDRLKAPIDGSCIIFSSPSTIECFFNCFSWNYSYKAVVIGKKTALYMPTNIPFVTSEKQTIDSCIDLCKKLSKKAL